MWCIKDKFGNVSELFPGDEIKVIRDSGKESTGRYLGECYKYRQYGHWYFSSSTHDNGSYCDYYFLNGSKKYLSIDESAYGKPLRISDASASTRIDETRIKEIIVLKRSYTKPIPVKEESIVIGKEYYSCSYSGPIMITIIKKFDDTGCVLVKTDSDKTKPFVRSVKYIFDNQDMARSAGRDWKHEERKRKRDKKEKEN